MILDDISDIMDILFLSGRDTYETMIIDDMWNIMDPVFISRIHKHEERWA